MNAHRTVATLALAVGVAAAGCEARIEAAPPMVVHGYDAVAVTPPVDIVSNPRLFYRGAYAYLYDERWFYSTPDGWVYFRTEPPPLYEYRTRYAKARGLDGKDGKAASKSQGLGGRTPLPGR